MSFITVIMTFVLVVSLVIIGFQAVKIKNLKENFFSVIPGGKLSGLDLITLDNEPFNETVFQEDRVVLFCLFEIPCAKCTKNLTPWKNITKFFRDRITSVGIILDGDPGAFRLFGDGRSNLKLSYPGNSQEFIKKMRLKTPLSQTIVVHKGIVKAVKIGNLTDDDVMDNLNSIKSIVKVGRGVTDEDNSKI